MPSPNPSSELEKPCQIKLTFTEAVVCAIVSASLALGGFSLVFMRLQKHGIHNGPDWITSLFLMFALLNLNYTRKFVLLAIRLRRLEKQDQQMQELQKRAGWL